MPVIILLFLFSLCFSLQNSSLLYEQNFNDDLKTINVNTNIEGENLQEQFNDQYHIDSEFLFELGITPYSALYMIDKNKR